MTCPIVVVESNLRAIEWLPHRLHIPITVGTSRFPAVEPSTSGLKYGDAVVKTYLIKAVAALGLLSVLAVAGVAASVAEPSYHGYPLHDWYTTDGY